MTIALEGVEAGGDDGQRRSQLMRCIGREAALDDKPSYDGLRPSLINGRLGATPVLQHGASERRGCAESGRPNYRDGTT